VSSRITFWPSPGALTAPGSPASSVVPSRIPAAKPRGHAGEVAGEGNLELGVALVAAALLVGLRVDGAGERDEADAGAFGAQAGEQRPGGCDLGLEDRVARVRTDDLLRVLAGRVEPLVGVLADDAVSVHVGAARVLGRLGHVHHDHHVEALGFLAGGDRGPAHLDDVLLRLERRAVARALDDDADPARRRGGARRFLGPGAEGRGGEAERREEDGDGRAQRSLRSGGFYHRGLPRLPRSLGYSM
jgi:hypothetical protein